MILKCNGISEISYDEWINIRLNNFEKYPVQPLDKHLRLDIELSYPRKSLYDIPAGFSPHIGGYDEIELFYVCEDWSVIFDIYKIKNSPHENPTLRMLVESGHENPWGERIRLFSTSSTIFHESWATNKNWHDFAYFRGHYWKITWNENFGGWPGGIVWGLPFQDCRHFDNEFFCGPIYEEEEDDDDDYDWS